MNTQTHHTIKSETMNFKEVEQVKFELANTITWGVESDKYGGFSIPVTINDENIKGEIENLSKQHDAKNPLYKNTLYLKSKGLGLRNNMTSF